MSKKDQELDEEVKKVFRMVIRFGILIRLGVYTKNQTALYVNEIIDGLKERVPSFWEMALRSSSREYIESIDNSSYTDDVIAAMKNDIAKSGLNPIQFVQNMEIDLSNIPMFSVNMLTKDVKKKDIKIIKINLQPRHNDIDFSIKEVGQRVEISHPLFTNMLVTSEGVQMPSKSFLEPAAIELMGEEAIVTQVDCDKFTYTCGACDQRHTADVKIAFPNYTMEFYINNDLLKVVGDEKNKK